MAGLIGMAGAATPGPPSPVVSPSTSVGASSDPRARPVVVGGTGTCVVGFEGDGVDLPPARHRSGARLGALPIPSRPGYVFAGWFPSSASAAAEITGDRVNGADIASCVHGRTTLFAAWRTPAQIAADPVDLPILLYHGFTTDPSGDHTPLRANYVYVGDFAAQMAYLRREAYYLPTWDEVEAFLDGRLSLPDRSVVITEDDADSSWLELGVPIVDSNGLLTTSFVISSLRSAPTPSLWVQQRSHTDDMHRPGIDGRGVMLSLPPAEVVADLERSAQTLGISQVMAYPFGEYDADVEADVSAAGYVMAVAVGGPAARPGDDPLALPRQRVDFGITWTQFLDILG